MNVTGTSGTEEEVGQGVIWKDKSKYFIRSACRHYNISKAFIVDVARYTAWFTEFPDNPYCRAVALGRAVNNVAAAQVLCDEHLRATIKSRI
jgi:hypothetical protein